MRRAIAALFTVLASGAVAGQTLYDPQVAYTQEAARNFNLMLANADGSRAVKVATYKGYIHRVDFAPGGGRLAYASPEGIRVLDYVASNTGIVVTQSRLLVGNTTPGVYAEKPDFSPDGTRIIFRLGTSPSTIRAIDATTGAVQFDFSCYLCEDPRWLRAELGNAFAFLRWNQSIPNQPAREAWIAFVNADGSITAAPVLDFATSPFKGVEDFDVAHTRNALLLSVNYATTMRAVEVDLLTGAITDRGTTWRMHFSSDDSRIVGLSPHSAKGDYVISTSVATGLETRLSTKGTFGVVDTRP
jgi:dipeptidyl aminopeptidase/acylaminoacyl peptidase